MSFDKDYPNRKDWRRRPWWETHCRRCDCSLCVDKRTRRHRRASDLAGKPPVGGWRVVGYRPICEAIRTLRDLRSGRAGDPAQSD